MNNGKSLGVDGVPCELYKFMWDNIGDAFSHMALEPFSIACLIEFINQGLIKLIPNKSHRDTIRDW